MLSEQDRLERAKLKLLSMNRKVQHAQSISKKRPSLPPLDDPARSPPRPSPPTYVFELTESMLADGFSEDRVLRYAALVERDSKCTDLDLDQRELALQAELKRINRAIARIRDPRRAAPRAATPPAADPEPAASGGYAETREARSQGRGQARPPPASREAAPAVRKRPPAPAHEAGVRATGAGAKFLADLMGDADGASPF
jgi:hypothetical protein